MLDARQQPIAEQQITAICAEHVPWEFLLRMSHTLASSADQLSDIELDDELMLQWRKMPDLRNRRLGLRQPGETDGCSDGSRELGAGLAVSPTKMRGRNFQHAFDGTDCATDWRSLSSQGHQPC